MGPGILGDTGGVVVGLVVLRDGEGADIEEGVVGVVVFVVRDGVVVVVIGVGVGVARVGVGVVVNGVADVFGTGIVGELATRYSLAVVVGGLYLSLRSLRSLLSLLSRGILWARYWLDWVVVVAAGGTVVVIVVGVVV